MTQKHPGTLAGFPEKTADIRMVQYESGEISKEDCDKWRYRFPEFDTTQIWAKVPSKELSDALVEAFKDKLKD